MRTALALITTSLMFAAAAGGADPAPGDGYAAGIDKWRQDFDKDVRTGGWLTLVGRYKVEEGEAAIGSDPKLVMSLPSGPARLGVLRRHNQTIEFEPAPDAAVTVDGKPVSGPVALSLKRPAGQLRSGSIVVTVRPIGEDYYALVVEPQDVVSV